MFLAEAASFVRQIQTWKATFSSVRISGMLLWHFGCLLIYSAFSPRVAKMQGW